MKLSQKFVDIFFSCKAYLEPIMYREISILIGLRLTQSNLIVVKKDTLEKNQNKLIFQLSVFLFQRNFHLM